jgi:hypothetical protein
MQLARRASSGAGIMPTGRHNFPKRTFPMIRYLIALAAMLVVGVASAQTSGTVNWAYSAPTQFTDGTAIPSTATITYNLYVGTAGPGSEAAAPVQTGIRFTSAITSGYTAGETVCGFVTSVVNGFESPHSPEACGTFSEVPGAPTNLTLKVNL